MPDELHLIVAAWLYRHGEKELAAKALACVDKCAEEITNVRNSLAWFAYAGMVHAYMVRADEEALEHGERLLRLYPEEAKKHQQSETIVRELKRRKDQGTFGKGEAKELPKDFAKLGTKKQIAFLIDALADVDARQMGQPAGIDLAGDFRVAALIKIGEPAVPALLDVLEKDERLTRSVHFWRDFATSRTVLSVREAALTSLMSIMRVRSFQPRSTGDNFTSRGEDVAKETAKKLRAYWKEMGGLSFDERMMKVLKDPKSRFEETREAADNLANLGAERTFGTTVWSDSFGTRSKEPNPAIKKFANPTTAEAILSAMNRDLANHDAQPMDFLHDFRRRTLEDQYLFPLINLGDSRIAPALAKHADAANSIRMRRNWAYAAFHLGETVAMKKFAVDFRDGKIKLPANDVPQTNQFDQPGYVELRGIVIHLSGVKLAEADRALHELAKPTHPAHAQAAKAVIAGGSGHQELGWTRHPYCLSILRAALDDEASRAIAIKRLQTLVSGLDRVSDVNEMKTFLDSNQGKLRLATPNDRVGELPWREMRFVVDSTGTK